MIKIYIDGGCVGPSGRGGWAYVTLQDGVRTEASGTNDWTTVNRMQLQAAVEALASIAGRAEIEVVTVSQYIAYSMSDWIERWKSSDWRTASGKKVENRAQWEELDRLAQQHQVTWTWIAGNGDADPHRLRCHLLAQEQAGLPAGSVPGWLKRRKTERANRKEVFAQQRENLRATRSATVDRIASAVPEIQAQRAAGGSYRKLAKQFQVPQSLIRSICKGRELSKWIGEGVPSA